MELRFSRCHSLQFLRRTVHAQGCSGGKDGGADATGNQCNTFNEVAAFTTGPAITPPAQVTKTVRAHAPGKKSTPTAIAVPASRQVRAAAPPSASAKTARMREPRREAFCSGGASSGMDVDGDECGGVSALTRKTAWLLSTICARRTASNGQKIARLHHRVWPHLNFHAFEL